MRDLQWACSLLEQGVIYMRVKAFMCEGWAPPEPEKSCFLIISESLLKRSVVRMRLKGIGNVVI